MVRTCRNAYAYLQRQHNGTQIVQGLRYVGPDLKVESAHGRLPGEDSRTYQELERLKERLTRDGLFRFDDMFAFAEKWVATQSWVMPALIRRFPFVFIDEMQDTDSIQASILEIIQGAGATVQRLGDCNQAIFRDFHDESGTTSFPVSNHASLTESRRFCQEIAGLASPLTAAGSAQQLVGNPAVASRRHTVFLFDSTSIHRVLPAFGGLVAEEIPDVRQPDFRAYAVGFRKTPPEASDPEKTPFCIRDYHPQFDGRLGMEGERPSDLIGFIRKARFYWTIDGHSFRAAPLIFDGVLELLRQARVLTPAGERVSKARLSSWIEQERPGSTFLLRNVLRELLFGGCLVDEDSWKAARDELLSVLAILPLDESLDPCQDFLGWCIDQCTQRAVETDEDQNVYVHQSPSGPVPIRLSSIHSSKGQTHTATLVLDTYHKTHDLKAVVPVLAGRQVRQTPALKNRMKRVFVAMTRPRELLCLAIRKDHVSQGDLDRLSSIGWAFVDLTSVEGGLRSPAQCQENDPLS